MKLGKALKVAANIGANLIPGGPAIVAAVNAFLPDDKKLAGTETGDEIEQRINGLPSETRKEIFLKDLDVEIADITAFRDNYAMAMQADMAGSSTRPKIAMMMAWNVFLASMVATVAWAVAVFSQNKEMLDTAQGSWPFILSVLSTQAVLLRAYFGLRTDEKNARYHTAKGMQAPPPSILGTIGKIFK